MRINKNRYNSTRRILAESDVTVEPEASELLFEAEDVAELVAEVTGDVVEVSAEGDMVTFAVGEGETAEEFVVTADGDEEILEASRRPLRGKRPVAAAKRPARPRRPVAASRAVRSNNAKTIRKIPSGKR